MNYSTGLLVVLLVALTVAQRPPYAGSRPSGYKNRLTSSTIPPTTLAGAAVPLDNRFGSGDASMQTTTQRLPVLALGDRELVNRLNQRPIDQRPFWLINAEAIEAQKNGSYPSAIAPVATSGFISSNSLSRPSSTSSTIVPLPSTTSNSVLSNRFGDVNTPINSNNIISQQEIVYPESALVLLSSSSAPTSNDRRPLFAQQSLLPSVLPQPVAGSSVHFVGVRNIEYDGEDENDYFH